jgi:hypothetical protein
LINIKSGDIFIHTTSFSLYLTNGPKVSICDIVKIHPMSFTSSMSNFGFVSVTNFVLEK